jgi:hypothetical protein
MKSHIGQFAIKNTMTAIHPFPARMAPSIVWEYIRTVDTKLAILDPMCGSGTSLVASRMYGHKAIGCDTDPLAVLISTVWSSNPVKSKVNARAQLVLERAKRLYGDLLVGMAYPDYADDETKAFVRYWFDTVARRQLAALSRCISRVRNDCERNILWCAFSRLIITKRTGVSLAIDVSHSRPHRIYDKAPVRPFAKFLLSVEKVLNSIPSFNSENSVPETKVLTADARSLPIASQSVDVVITSPPKCYRLSAGP